MTMQRAVARARRSSPIWDCANRQGMSRLKRFSGTERAGVERHTGHSMGRGTLRSWGEEGSWSLMKWSGLWRGRLQNPRPCLAPCPRWPAVSCPRRWPEPFPALAAARLHGMMHLASSFSASLVAAATSTHHHLARQWAWPLQHASITVWSVQPGRGERKVLEPLRADIVAGATCAQSMRALETPRAAAPHSRLRLFAGAHGSRGQASFFRMRPMVSKALSGQFVRLHLPATLRVGPACRSNFSLARKSLPQWLYTVCHTNSRIPTQERCWSLLAFWKRSDQDMRLRISIPGST
jgi:hypothetical protein